MSIKLAMIKKSASSQVSRTTKKMVTFCLLAAIVAILIIVQAKYFNIQEILTQALEWVDGLGSWGPVAFVILYNLATVLFLPGAILTLGGGVIFGVIWGSIYVFIASTLGATCAFLIGRYLSRHWVTRQIKGNSKFKAINQAVAKEGLKVVFLTRLSPIFPFNLLNYAFGVTQVSLRDYFLGSTGMIPGTVMYVYLGSVIGDLAMLSATCSSSNPQAKAIHWLIHGLGLLITVFVTFYITRLANQALKVQG
ncbi:MAG: TVP38/TMEM64 family protein [Coleofasciculaceae cyanobacterium]